MSEKVVIPKEVAEAIEFQKAHGHEWLLFDTDLINEERHSHANRSLGVIYRYYAGNKREYFTALVNGYTVEQMPEEKVREYYERMMHTARCRTYGRDEAIFITRGITKTLNLLGIKIEGINA